MNVQESSKQDSIGPLKVNFKHMKSSMTKKVTHWDDYTLTRFSRRKIGAGYLTLINQLINR